MSEFKFSDKRVLLSTPRGFPILTAFDALSSKENSAESNVDSASPSLFGVSSNEIQLSCMKTLEKVDQDDLVQEIESVIETRWEAITTSFYYDQSMNDNIHNSNDKDHHTKTTSFKSKSTNHSPTTYIQDLTKTTDLLLNSKKQIQEKREKTSQLMHETHETFELLFDKFIRILKHYQFSSLLERHEWMTKYYSMILDNMALKLNCLVGQLQLELFGNPNDSSASMSSDVDFIHRDESSLHVIIWNKLNQIQNELQSELDSVNRHLDVYEGVGESFKNIVVTYSQLNRQCQELMQDIDLMLPPE